jgi:hypothetical protein
LGADELNHCGLEVTMPPSVRARPLALEIYSNNRYPNTLASGIQAVRVAESFAHLGLPTTFWYRRGAMRGTDWQRLYGVQPRFWPRHYPGIYVRGRRLPLRNDLVTRLTFTARIGTATWRRRRLVVYGWNPNGFPLNWLLALRHRLGSSDPLIACEAHEGKDWTHTRLPHADAIIAISAGVQRDLVAAGIAAEALST